MQDPEWVAERNRRARERYHQRKAADYTWYLDLLKKQLRYARENPEYRAKQAARKRELYRERKNAGN
jgi:hypothetical protein